jgi:DNA helicase HerA-like ATPase
MANKIHEEIQNSKRLGVVGSPSTNTNISIDVSDDSYEASLLGNFCIMETLQNDCHTYPIGQVTSISLRNPYLERHSIRKIISVRGEASPLTKQHDIRLVDVSIGSCFTKDKAQLIPSILGSVPPTGSPVYQLNQELVDAIIGYLSTGVSYIGRMYNTEIILPMVFKHFEKGDEGLGEAYHLGIFGKTGSGKSVLARMIMGCYTKNDPMSILVIDPQGEYSRELRTSGNLVNILATRNRHFEVVDVSRIALTSLDALKKVVLASGFLDKILVRAEENKVYAAEQIAEFFEQPKPVVLPTGQKIYTKLANACDKEVFLKLVDHLEKNIKKIYVSKEPQERVLDKLKQSNILYRNWVKLANLFSTKKKVKVDDILEKSTSKRLVYVIDLSGETQEDLLWNPQIQSIVIKEIARSLYQEGSRLYRLGKTFNLLVVMDEAHRLIPREKPKDEYFAELKNTLIDSVRTTRKYGLGWMFISQSLASLDREILRQLRIYFFGYGLSWGGELRVLQELVGGGDSIEFYQSFKDPQTSALFGRKEYPFMVYGPVSPLSSSGAPMFFTALNYDEEYTLYNHF